MPPVIKLCAQRQISLSIASPIVPEQQVQRWEANSYSGVSVDRLQDVADALGVRISETVAYTVPA